MATAWVVALVGTRVYPVQAPQQAAPYVVYELAAGIRIRVGREHGLPGAH